MTVILFDLDGTLSDSAPGIIGSLRAAFDELGLARLDPVTEQTLIGPPFGQSLPPLVGAARAADVIAAYRRHYGAGGMFDTRLYPGIGELVVDLADAGHVLAVATSKPEHYAVPIVTKLFGPAPHPFRAVAGDTMDDARPTKAAVIAEALHRLGADPADAVMVGDRAQDVEGARALGIDCLGAGWGYGLPGELAQAGARTVLQSPEALRSLLASPPG